MVDTALFDAAAVEAEKRIVLQEKGRMSELSRKMQETSWPLFYAGLKIQDRLTIGTDATLQAANAAGLRAFYERWYRPERATIVMVGDADPKLMEELIAKRFGDWQGAGPAPKEPDYGSIRKLQERAVALAYPGSPYSASLMWLRPYQTLPNTKAREKADLARSLAARILNRRLEAKARAGASYVNAGFSENRSRNIADMTSLSVTAREGRWQEALNESFAIIADALRAPPSLAEIEREISNLKSSALSAVQSEPTVKSPQWAQLLVNAVDDETVVASAPVSQALIEELSKQMTPSEVAAGMKLLFSGAGPRLALLSPDAVSLPAVNAALSAAEKAAPAVRQADRKVSMDSLPRLGAAGKEVSRQRIEDLGVTIVRFANGTTLLFKQTDFEKGSVQVQLRFGEGITGLSPTQPSYTWLGGLVSPSGFADFDLDAMERLLTGRRMNISFGVDEDAFVLRGATNGTDLPDQLRLLATKLAYPRWDAPLFARFQAGALEATISASPRHRHARDANSPVSRGRTTRVGRRSKRSRSPRRASPTSSASSRRCWQTALPK
jgi:zinc protease